MEHVLLRSGAVHVCIHCVNEAKELAAAQHQVERTGRPLRKTKSGDEKQLALPLT
jgi:hypothetical protein